MTEEINAEVENTEQTIEEQAPELLTLRESIEQAAAKHEPAPEAEKHVEEQPTPTKQEIQTDVNQELKPPSEFSADGKKAWEQKDISGIQREYERINKSRLQELSRAQTAEQQARQEAKTWRELGEMAKPYIEARGGEGVTPQQAMMEALALIQEIKKSDPATVKQQLAAIGIDLDKAPGSTVDNSTKQQIDALQNVTNELLREREQIKLNQLAQGFDSVFNSLTAQKTRTGQPVFPDLLDNSESGVQFASQLGSLTQDAKFQQGVLRRFPDADFTTVVREAYKYLGGKVAGEPVKVSASNNNKQNSRAAAVTPVRRAPTATPSIAGTLSLRESIERAFLDLQEE